MSGLSDDDSANQNESVSIGSGEQAQNKLSSLLKKAVE